VHVSNASVSEIAAVKALFGEIVIHGHLPVSIPNIAAKERVSNGLCKLAAEALNMGKNKPVSKHSPL